MKSADERIKEALGIAWKYAQIDGSWHKMWTIDQMVRILCGGEEEYNNWIAEYMKPFINDDGKVDYYDWDVGIAP